MILSKDILSAWSNRILLGSVLVAILSVAPPTQEEPEWGFFAHRRINRLAVFTLDPDMMPFFRSNLEYLTDHAVDPDKRRYATRHEAVRHYIDIDHWGVFPFDQVPRDWAEALLWKAEIQQVRSSDTISWTVSSIEAYPSNKVWLKAADRDSFFVDLSEYRSFWYSEIIPQYYEDDWILDCSSLVDMGWPSYSCEEVRVIDHFSEYGILPFHLLQHQRRLTRAFQDRRPGRILQLAAEMGHYIGDATVPLHTTENYNGQLTNQIGIHGFWESRIPELIADETFDFLVGKADYIEDPQDFYWDIVLSSHLLVDSVLNTERRLSIEYPQDQQFCFENRLESTVRTQCAEYALAWNAAMKGMVEERFRTAIHAIGSVWYTAWVDAGQPDLKGMGLQQELLTANDSLNRAVQTGEIKGRVHE